MSNRRMTIELDGKEVACEVLEVWHSGAKVRLDDGRIVDVALGSGKFREAASKAEAASRADTIERERGS